MNYGEIYELGPHRLMCGDATKREDVMRLVGSDHIDLVLTDPPYGYRVQHKSGAIGGDYIRKISLRNDVIVFPRHYSLLIGDDNTDMARGHYSIARELTNRMIIWGGQNFADFLPVSPAWLFWDKQNGGCDFSDGELAWCSWGKKIRKYEHKWNGVIRQGSMSLNLKTRTHPTQKPVELHMKILEDFTKPGNVILDCFGGSGTTLIACNETGRKCLMMDISPEYCDLIINRWETLMNDKAHMQESAGVAQR